MKNWIQSLLSDKDNVSSTRCMLLLVNIFVIVSSSLLFICDAFTADKGWFLVSFASLAWGGKTVTKFKEKPRYSSYDN